MLAPRTHADSLSPRLPCRHCGQACDDRPLIAAEGTFCCRGCQSVYALLQREGLDRFYTCDLAAPGVSQRDAEHRAPDRFAALDDPGIAATFVEFSDGRTARARLPVPSLHCVSCVWLLERLWRLDPGVTARQAAH